MSFFCHNLKFHWWNAWENVRVINHYHYESDKHPFKSMQVQHRYCKTCNKLETREVKI